MNTTNKNMARYKSFSWVLDHMDMAIEKGFPLEAIALQESLISDRLWAEATDAEVALTNSRHGPGISELIKKLGDKYPGERIVFTLDGGSHTVADLWGDLKNWKNERNEFLHAFVKAPPDQPTNPVTTMQASAKTAAEEGRKLCHAVLAWRKKKKRDRENSGASV